MMRTLSFDVLADLHAPKTDGKGATWPWLVALLAAAALYLARLVHDYGAYARAFACVPPGSPIGSVALAGFVAQLVDGSLGMGYGVTSSTVLVAAGLTPKTASASVHLAQLFTTFISGLAHHSFGNVDTRVTARLAGAGSVGAFVGAALLATVPSSAARAISATLLSGMGAYVFYRFYRAESTQCRPGAPSLSLLVPLGLAGGFVDATGGGGWGPVATSGLLADHRLSPTRVIGTVSASEFFVTVAAVLGFVGSSVGLADGAEPDAPPALRLELVAMLILGGVVAAPVAPLLVIVGAFVFATNVRHLLRAAAHW